MFSDDAASALSTSVHLPEPCSCTLTGYFPGEGQKGPQDNSQQIGSSKLEF